MSIRYKNLSGLPLEGGVFNVASFIRHNFFDSSLNKKRIVGGEEAVDLEFEKQYEDEKSEHFEKESAVVEPYISEKVYTSRTTSKNIKRASNSIKPSNSLKLPPIKNIQSFKNLSDR